MGIAFKLLAVLRSGKLDHGLGALPKVPTVEVRNTVLGDDIVHVPPRRHDACSRLQ